MTGSRPMEIMTKVKAVRMIRIPGGSIHHQYPR
jgi:hypothetical protein